MSISRVIGAGVVMVLAAAPSALAQVEVSGNIGYVSSEGVTTDGILAGDGNIYDEISPVSGLGYHFTFGVMAGEQFEVGFLWGRQQSELEVGGTNAVTIGDMNIDNYHGYFQYNFGDSSSKVRPFVMGGLGATKYGNVDFTRLNGQAGTIDSNTRFSTTWGGGVKAYASDHLGFRAAARWTPTYIKSDDAGWWCDPVLGLLPGVRGPVFESVRVLGRRHRAILESGFHRCVAQTFRFARVAGLKACATESKTALARGGSCGATSWTSATASTCGRHLPLVADAQSRIFRPYPSSAPPEIT